MAELVAELRLQEDGWQRNDVLRTLYRSWFAELAALRGRVPGASVELGSGIGKLREAVPDVVLTDVKATPWSTDVVDAEALPYADGELANLFLVDVLHHVPRPAQFLDEAVRCLAPGGRVLLLEPYCSPVSYALYRRYHHETTDLDRDPFAEASSSSSDALDSNQAIPTLVFFRGEKAFRARWPELDVVVRRRLALVAYPLSGGWRRRRVLPSRLLGATLLLERVLAPLAPLCAFRCLVVLERV